MPVRMSHLKYVIPSTPPLWEKYEPGSAGVWKPIFWDGLNVASSRTFATDVLRNCRQTWHLYLSLGDRPEGRENGVEPYMLGLLGAPLFPALINVLRVYKAGNGGLQRTRASTVNTVGKGSKQEVGQCLRDTSSSRPLSCIPL